MEAHAKGSRLKADVEGPSIPPSVGPIVCLGETTRSRELGMFLDGDVSGLHGKVLGVSAMLGILKLNHTHMERAVRVHHSSTFLSTYGLLISL